MSDDHTQTILFFVVLSFGIASLFMRDAGALGAAMNNWEAGCFVLGSVILFRMVMAPFWLDQEKNEEISRSRGNTIAVASLKDWTQLDPLELWQIAFLWCGHHPGTIETAPSAVKIEFEKLKRAVFSGDLGPDWNPTFKALFKLNKSLSGTGEIADDGHFVTTRTKIRLSELRRYANAIKERPMFLFAESIAAIHEPQSPPSIEQKTQP